MTSSTLEATPAGGATQALTSTVSGSAPTGVKAAWLAPDPSGSTDTLVATWTAAHPHDSPVDQYSVMISGSDGAGTHKQTVSGSTLTARFPVDSAPNWSVKVRAHNAAGWSPWSAGFKLGGL